MSTASDDSIAAKAPRLNGRRLKAASLIGALALAGLALLAGTQPWFTATLTGEAAGHPPLSAAGDLAAPALSALAIAALAATGALAIAGPVFRIILVTLQLILGACIVLSCVPALIDPIGALEPLVTAATSVSGRGAVSSLVGEVAVTGWPFAALGSGVLLVILDLGALLSSRSWPASGRKYQAVRLEQAEEPGSAVSDWDALSEGEDPTSPG